MKENGCHLKTLVWPPNSPDLSPIENIWGIVDSKVQARGCSSFEEFKEAVLEELKAVPKATLVKLSKSMKHRLEMMVKKGGDRIPY
jgi:transposase